MGLRELLQKDGLGQHKAANNNIGQTKTEKQKLIAAADRMIKKLEDADTDLNAAVSNQHWWSARGGETTLDNGKVLKNARFVKAKYGGKAIDADGDYISNDKDSIKAHIIKLRASFEKLSEKDLAGEKKARVK
jgi:hypothetical protein